MVISLINISIFIYSISPRRIMLIGMITQIICGNLTGLVTIFEVHVFFRCLSAACCAIMLTGGSTICKFIK